MNEAIERDGLPPPAVRHPHPHESAHLHVAGEATYVDDLPEPAGTAHAALALSTQAHARIVAMDLAAVLAAPGVIGVLVAADIPGRNDCGPVVHDDPILAAEEVHYVGQPVFAVVAAAYAFGRIPGMDARAPERTDTSSGFSVSPNFFPMDASRRPMYSRISARIPSLICSPSA